MPFPRDQFSVERRLGAPGGISLEVAVYTLRDIRWILAKVDAERLDQALSDLFLIRYMKRVIILPLHLLLDSLLHRGLFLNELQDELNLLLLSLRRCLD